MSSRMQSRYSIPKTADQQPELSTKEHGCYPQAARFVLCSMCSLLLKPLPTATHYLVHPQRGNVCTTHSSLHARECGHIARLHCLSVSQAFMFVLKFPRKSSYSTIMKLRATDHTATPHMVFQAYLHPGTISGSSGFGHRLEVAKT